MNIYGDAGYAGGIPRAPDVTLPLLEKIPFVGDVIGQLNILIWLGLLTCFLTWLLVFRTPTGLRLRSVGENPLAARDGRPLAGRAIRYLAVPISGALAAIGGAYLSIGFVGSFTREHDGGQGFIALAVMICGRWLPQGALVFALPVRVLQRARPAAAGVLPVGRHAVPGAPVRGHADHRGGRGRPLDPAGRDRPPAWIADAAPPVARPRVLCDHRGMRGLAWIAPLLALGARRGGSSDTERFSLTTPGTDDPVVREIEGSEKPRRGKPTP